MKKIFCIVLVIALTLSLSACQMSSKEKQAIYDKLEGDYTDATSQRAVADVTSNDGFVSIYISWGNSVSEWTEWSMTAKLDKDGRLSYSDMVSKDCSYDEATQTVSEATVVEKGSGYFTIDEDKLCWEGAEEYLLKECIFEKMVQ